MTKKFTKGNPPNHVEWTESFLEGVNPFSFVPADGNGNRNLIEPVPQYFFRNGDKWLEGENNTLIVLGRDRAPENADEVFTNNSLKRNDQSGYSNNMGAGAIDIVVGRGAPFPLAETQFNEPFVLGPLFNTVYPDTIEGYPLIEGKEHPGMAMDAARIYISQMTNIDENFMIKNPLPQSIFDNNNDNILAILDDEEKVPTSGIMIKADKVRMHARQNIALITRGIDETMNSQGRPIATSNIGIHLIANNGLHYGDGSSAPQEPLVLGTKLLAALDTLSTMVEESVRITSNFVEIQGRFNMKLASHFHFSPPGLALPDIQSSIQGIITALESLTKVQLMGVFSDINNASFKTTYLKESSKAFICSRYNTSN